MAGCGRSRGAGIEAAGGLDRQGRPRGRPGGRAGHVEDCATLGQSGDRGRSEASGGCGTARAARFGPAVRREALWMLSEIAGDEAVGPTAALLADQELREDARMVLDRIPGPASLAALRDALNRASDDFRYNLAQSLRHRGVGVPDVPERKLVPVRPTSVKAAEP
jgi:hypothetical protein